MFTGVLCGLVRAYGSEVHNNSVTPTASRCDKGIPYIAVNFPVHAGQQLSFG